MYRMIIVLMLSTTLGACGMLAQDRAGSASLEDLVQAPASSSSADVTGSTSQSANAALASGAGHVVKADSKKLGLVAMQTAIYDQAVTGLKPNEVTVRVIADPDTAKNKGAANARELAKPLEGTIHAELASEFPRMDMRIVNPPRQNAYGVYGMAVGILGNGVRCVYAWQWLDGLSAAEGDGLVGPLSIRARLCRADATLDQLAGYMDALKIKRGAAEPMIGVADVSGKQKPPQQLASALDNEKPPSLPSKKPATRRAPAAVTAGSTAIRVDESFASQPSSLPDPSLPAAAYRGPLTASAR